MVEWDFTLPAAEPVGVDSPAVLDAALFRPVPSTGIGEAMVFCIGCGDPMQLSAALAHTCDLPPAGWL